MNIPDPRRVTEAPAPPVSGKNQPKFASIQRKAELATAFLNQGAAYDELRPGYPAEIVNAMIAAAHTAQREAVIPDCAAAAPQLAAIERAGDTSPTAAPDRPGETLATAALTAVDLGAGTGKLAVALAQSGCQTIAIDPSEAMLAEAERSARAQLGTDPATNFRTIVASAEATTLGAATADLVVAAQAWHWFDAAKASSEVIRIAKPGAVLALVWNTLDVSVPWVHRYSRIAHSGDVQREDFLPEGGEGIMLDQRIVHRWVDRRSTWDFVNLAKTRSYVITANEAQRKKVLDNLDWYLHDFLGHEPGSQIEMPYRTDLFLYRVASTL